jgi:N-[(2S)-2-amino-2-carboxyethyl]-L-glutamate dehydrogenase
VTEHGRGVWYLSGTTVRRILRNIDVVETVIETSIAHAQGKTILPPESYLGWTTPSGSAARSLGMAGYIDGDPVTVGVKLINASLGNSSRGLPRASGVTVLLDPETARVRVLMDAAPVSAARTAGVSVAALRELPADPVDHVALIGCGVQARAHVDLMIPNLHALKKLSFFDVSADVAEAFEDAVTPEAAGRGIALERCRSARDAVLGADAVITATTAGKDDGYLAAEWLASDVVVVHVSLDDLLPGVVEAATTIIVDDWELVAADDKRLFGRMYREGSLSGPDAPARSDSPRVAGELGRFLRDASTKLRGLTVVNPFGMAVHDVALAARVAAVAMEEGTGQWLEWS